MEELGPWWTVLIGQALFVALLLPLIVAIGKRPYWRYVFTILPMSLAISPIWFALFGLLQYFGR